MSGLLGFSHCKTHQQFFHITQFTAMQFKTQHIQMMGVAIFWSQFSNLGNTAMFCLDPVDQHFIKTLKYCSATFRRNFFLLIYWEVLEIIEEASMARTCNMNWFSTTSTLICQKLFCGKTDKN